MKKVITFASTILTIMCVGLLSIWLGYSVQGQATTTLECNSEMWGYFAQEKEDHFYFLEMLAGESFTVSLVPVGDSLKSSIAIYGPTGKREGISYNELKQEAILTLRPSAQTKILSADGTYKIQVANVTINNLGGHYDAPGLGGPGRYQLFVECNKLTPPTPSSALLPVPLSIPDSIEEFSSILEINRRYEMFFAGELHTVTVLELNHMNWAKIALSDTNNNVWLNLNQVTYFMLAE